MLGDDAQGDPLATAADEDVVARTVKALIDGNITSGEYWITAGEHALTVSRIAAVLERFVTGIGAGELAASIDRSDIEPDFIVPQSAQLAAVNFPGAIWRPSPNFNSRNGWAVHAIVIHTCEGNYTGCWSWLRNPAAGASAHYVVSESGNEVSQLVDEANRAWHVAASYDCSRVEGHDCAKNGVSVNNFSVGIEHVDDINERFERLLAAGAEVQHAVKAREALEADGVGTRVVSMPCVEWFDAQDEAYREQVLPPTVRARVFVEKSSSRILMPIVRPLCLRFTSVSQSCSDSRCSSGSNSPSPLLSKSNVVSLDSDLVAR